MIDHFTLKVSDGAKSKAFYAAALRPLGYAVAMEFGSSCGLGVGGKPDLWLAEDPGSVRATHFALHTRHRKVVDDFYAAALAAGARDNGPPGIRKDYHPNYYAAFVLDPDGHNVEVVCHAPVRAVARKPARKRPAARARAKKRARR
ncbi:MAG TPA: VOC family protein [Anaeromyxobacteraceae bacterium]|nr:VOC family protein [Anaeromyxobacteraceae bacterium]